MRVIRSCRVLQKLGFSLRQRGKSIGFVPTMGCLHEGHLSLVRRARRETDVVVVSIFVNPTQFGPKEDYKQYPRDLVRDLKLCRREKVDVVFVPSARAIYPPGFNSFMEPGRWAECLCGKSRPGHFRGVATVVAKLFHLVQPHVSYFGQKDYQQALIVKQMVQDLHLPVRVIVCPTVRDGDGLALSSRNVYLDPVARVKALCLFRALRWTRKRVQEGRRDVSWLKRGIRKILRSGLSHIDYGEILRARDLSPLSKVSGTIVVALAGFVALKASRAKRREVRLIDNDLIRVS